jgi:dTDP-4-dehydrorhamnose reductase
MKNIYIAGCGGMLGEAFYRQFKEKYQVKCTDIDVNEQWLTSCDVRDMAAYRKDVTDFRPDFLFHLPAFTDLEFCELHPEETYVTNTLAVENAVTIANEIGIPLLYIRTAGIFDGKKEVYDDWDQPNPLGHYARSKYAGELFVRDHAERYLTCRAGWMMGGGPRKDKKFVQKLMRQLKSGKKELAIVNDKLGTPTYTHDFAKNVRLLLETGNWGLFNMVCSGVTGRLEVAKELISLLGLREKVSIREVTSDHFREEYFAERPPSERLINRRLRLRGLDVMRDWRISLKEYLDTYYKNYLSGDHEG